MSWPPRAKIPWCVFLNAKEAKILKSEASRFFIRCTAIEKLLFVWLGTRTTRMYWPPVPTIARYGCGTFPWQPTTKPLPRAWGIPLTSVHCCGAMNFQKYCSVAVGTAQSVCGTPVWRVAFVCKPSPTTTPTCMVWPVIHNAPLHCAVAVETPPCACGEWIPRPSFGIVYMRCWVCRGTNEFWTRATTIETTMNEHGVVSSVHPTLMSRGWYNL